MIPTTITHDHVNRALGLVQKVIDACGTRLPGSDGDLKAADLLYQEMRAFDDSTQEEFTFAPNAFLGFFDIFVGSFLVATLFLFFGGPQLYGAAVVLTIGVLAGISQFVFYWGWFDIFYRKKKGVNVVGLIHPENAADVKQEIIVCGHHDSAWVVNFLLKHQKLYAVRLILGVGVIVTAYLLTVLLAILYARTGSDPFPLLANFVKYGSLLGFFFAVPLLFYRDRNAATCGAGDNLISSSMALQIGKIFHEAKNSGSPLLKHTRVRVISFDAEEAGLKGSKAYVRRHRRELSNIPAYALCPECIYRMKHFRFLTSDQNGLLKTPPQIVNEAVAIAGQLGYCPAIAAFPFGGGATDAASFLRIGVPALTIMGMDTGLFRNGLVYHTPHDLVENIDREVVEATMKIMLAYILAKDKELNPK
ncbi:MAG: M28 family metallopeptidase [Thermoguttaceae bacterium]